MQAHIAVLLNRIRLAAITVSAAYSFLVMPAAFSQEASLAPFAESTYFTVWAPAGMDTLAILKKLNFDYFTRPEQTRAGSAEDVKKILSATLDSIYLEVSDILDIHIYSYKGTIKILPDKAAISRVFRAHFNADFNERSFYLLERDTIYISFEDMTLGMLGHETAHAIITHFFVVPPPTKIQEVLAGYVEYQLRKASGTLSR